MNFRTRTLTWRARHTEAGKRLQEDRDAFFSDQLNVLEMVRRVRGGHHQALRDLARELRDRGLYAPTTALGQIELRVMKRLRASHKPGMPWDTFVRSTVGMGWMAPDRHRDRRAA